VKRGKEDETHSEREEEWRVRGKLTNECSSCRVLSIGNTIDGRMALSGWVVM